MKPRFGREIALLCLPFLVIGGAALWKSRAPGLVMPTPPLMAPLPMSPAVPSSLIPSTIPVPIAQVKLGKVDLKRMGPVCSQNAWSDADAQVSATLLVPMGPWLRPVAAPPPSPSALTPSSRMPSGSIAPRLPGAMNFSTGSGGFRILSMFPDAVLGLKRADWDFLDQSGAVLPAPDGAWSGPGPTILMRPPLRSPFPSQVGSASGGATRDMELVNQRFDLDRVPASRGAVRLQGSLILHGGAVKIHIPVRPAWFTRAPRTLKLASLKWRAPENGDEGSVEVALRSSANPPLMLVPEPTGSAIAWQIAPAPPGVSGREVFPQRKLLYNWSPRLESVDGQYNSHAAKDIKVWSRYRHFLANPRTSGAGMLVQTYLSDFYPKIWAQNPVQKDGLIQLRYHFYGLSGFQGRPVFKTEIGVPGDGFLRLSLPLPLKGER